MKKEDVESQIDLVDYINQKIASEGVSFEDALKVKSDLDRFLENKRLDRKRQILKEFLDICASSDFTIEEIFDFYKGRKLSKYQHPSNNSLTWSGRGRKPRWLVDELNNGMKLEDFRK